MLGGRIRTSDWLIQTQVITFSTSVTSFLANSTVGGERGRSSSSESGDLSRECRQTGARRNCPLVCAFANASSVARYRASFRSLA